MGSSHVSSYILMGTKPKIRFVAIVDGRCVELFSVREPKADRLLITPRSPPLVEAEGTSRAIREQHCSVHATNGGKDTTITLKQIFQDDTKLDYVTMVHNTEAHLLWTIFARRVGVSEALYERGPPQRDKDLVHTIADYRGQNANLIFSAFIARPSFQPPDPPEGVGIHVHQFKSYSIIVLTSFLNVPSIPQGDLSSFSTSMPSNGEIDISNHLRVHAEPMEAHDLYGKHWLITLILCQKLVDRLSEVLKSFDQPELERFLKLAATFTSLPLVK